MARPVVWPLVADPTRFNRGFREAERTADRAGRAIRRTATLIGGAFAAVQVAGFLKGAIDEAREAAKVGRQTQAVIKATGGVARVSAKDVDWLATALSNKAGVDDEVIAAGANMLLTFKGVRNEVGRGNDVFNQASAVILDMTAAMHQGQVTQQGLEKATIQVGKALNDPIKGITALTRVGVTFTDKQKEQIRTLVESGRTMDAQRIILRELASEFGGAAAAAADPWQRLGVVFGNVKESIGNLLLPALSNAASFIADKLIPAAQRFADQHGPAFREAFSRANQIISVVWRKLRDDLWPEILRGARYLRENLGPEVDKLTSAWRDNSEAITGLKTDLKPLIDNVFPILAKLIRGTSEEIRGAISLVGWLARAWQAVRRPILTVVHALVREVLAGFGQILHGAAAAFGWVPNVGAKLRNARDAFDKFQQDVNEQFSQIITGKTVRLNVRGTFTPPPGMSMRDIVFRARGGPIAGPGTTTSDSIPAMLSHGEHVWSAREVRGAGGHQAMAAMRAEARGFARGGGVTVDPNFPSAGAMARAGASAVGRIAGLIDRNVRAFARLAGNPAILAFLRRADALPYVWGGAGPGAYDCSGLASAVYGLHTGRGGGHGQRYFTTSSIGGAAGRLGLRPGLGGVLSLGVTAGTGHMAGSYLGLGFEAESTRTGIKIGPAASSPASFARQFHMARGGPVDGRLVDLLRRTGVDIGGDPGRLRVNGKVFDRGGFLMPGATLAVNNTGRPEPVGFPTATEIARALADELRRNPPVVAIRDLQQGMNAYAGRLGQPRPYR